MKRESFNAQTCSSSSLLTCLLPLTISQPSSHISASFNMSVAIAASSAGYLLRLCVSGRLSVMWKSSASHQLLLRLLVLKWQQRTR